MVQNVFISGLIPKSVNDSCIVLIPKAKQPTLFKSLPPISLCNTVYKVITKLISVRIKSFLDKLIFLTQAAFVLGRWISENSILVNELTHTMRKKRGGKGLVAIKLDMNRAFDRIECRVISNIMQQFGFSCRVVSLIMQYVDMESMALLLNGSVHGRFRVKRGI